LGDVVTGAESEGVLQAGTRRRYDGGGGGLHRRPGAVGGGHGPDLAAARDDAHRRLAGVRLLGSHHRTDIALRAVQG
jgi:phosphoribosylamine--glycine ligase